jgi:hypothetical protein
MAQGDANKVWMLPNDFGKALEGFAKALGAPGDDGVFRYEPPAYEPPQYKEEDEEEIKSWFDMASDPQVAEAVRAAEAVARKEVPGPLTTTTPTAVRPLGPPAITPPPLPDLPADETTDEPPPPPTSSSPPPLPKRQNRRPSESTELSDDEPPRF